MGCIIAYPMGCNIAYPTSIAPSLLWAETLPDSQNVFSIGSAQ
jgi:hypothetical protein